MHSRAILRLTLKSSESAGQGVLIRFRNAERPASLTVRSAWGEPEQTGLSRDNLPRLKEMGSCRPAVEARRLMSFLNLADVPD